MPNPTQFIIAILLLTVLAAGVLLSRSNTELETNQETGAPEVTDTMSAPPATEPVGNSAPPFALAACAGKAVGDSCELGENESTVAGMCHPSGDQLACGPSPQAGGAE